MPLMRFAVAVMLILAAACLAVETQDLPRRPAGRGRLVRVEDKTIVVAIRKLVNHKVVDELVAVDTSDTTRFYLDGDRVKISDLKSDIEVEFRRMDRNREDSPLIVAGYSPGLWGTLIKREGNELTLRTNAPGGGPAFEQVVTADANTKVLFTAWIKGDQREPGGVGTLDDLKPGMEVQIIGAESGPAKQIHATRRQPPP